MPHVHGQLEPLATDLCRRGYSVSEVAEQLSVSVKTVRRLVRDGHLQHIRVGRRVVVLAASLAAFLEQPR